jgi:hypothetical protein
MSHIKTLIELRKEIAELEITQVSARQDLVVQLRLTYESLRPANLIKHTFKELTTAPDVKLDFLNSIMAMAAGFLSKKLLVGKSHNPLKQVVGTMVQLGVTNLVTRNGNVIKSAAFRILTSFFVKKKDKL